MADGPRGQKVVAVLVVLLLVGNEARRIASANHYQPRTEAEETMEKLTFEQCTKWSLKKGCHDNCQFKPLPFDHSPSASCRLSTDYMLRDDQAAKMFLDLEGQRLTETAARVRTDCAEAGSRKRAGFAGSSKRCVRRGALTVQLTRFMIQAQERVRNGTLSPESAASIERHVEHARDTFAKALGEDAPYFVELTNKVRANAVDILKNPNGFKSVVQSMRKLRSHHESVKEEARQAISAMQMRTSSQPTAEEIEQMKAAAKKYDSRGSTREENGDSWKQLEETIASLGSDTDEVASALMEGNADYIGDAALGDLIVDVLLIIMVVLMLGCAIYLITLGATVYCLFLAPFFLIAMSAFPFGRRLARRTRALPLPILKGSRDRSGTRSSSLTK